MIQKVLQIFWLVGIFRENINEQEIQNPLKSTEVKFFSSNNQSLIWHVG